MDSSRIDPRTVALALLCLSVIAFAAATVDTTTTPDTEFGAGSGGPAEQVGDPGTPVATESGATDDGRPSFFDMDGGTPPFSLCVPWLTRPLVQIGLLLGLVGLFLVGTWYDDAMFGLGVTVLVAYPGVFAYFLLLSCNSSESGALFDLSPFDRPSQPQGGGLLGGETTVTSPSFVSQLLLVVVVALLGVVAVLVLTGNHDQLRATADEDDPEAADDEGIDERVDVAAIGAAAGRAADRLEREGEFENEVFRAWAEMTEPLTVDHPESSTPAEFAEAAVRAGIDHDDVERLTALFEEVRYGGADPTPEREREAVETLRRIEATYGDETGGEER